MAVMLCRWRFSARGTHPSLSLARSPSSSLSPRLKFLRRLIPGLKRSLRRAGAELLVFQEVSQEEKAESLQEVFQWWRSWGIEILNAVALMAPCSANASAVSFPSMPVWDGIHSTAVWMEREFRLL